MMKRFQFFLLLLLFTYCAFDANAQGDAIAQSFPYFQNTLTNIAGRKTTSLNGKWQAVIDPRDIGIGEWKSIWKDKKPTGKSDFYEYAFDGGTVLDVPGSL